MLDIQKLVLLFPLQCAYQGACIAAHLHNIQYPFLLLNLMSACPSKMGQEEICQAFEMKCKSLSNKLIHFLFIIHRGCTCLLNFEGIIFRGSIKKLLISCLYKGVRLNVAIHKQDHSPINKLMLLKFGFHILNSTLPTIKLFQTKLQLTLLFNVLVDSRHIIECPFNLDKKQK